MKTNNLPMFRYIIYMSGIVLRVGLLVFLLSSCIEEMGDDRKKPHTGSKIAINFKFAGISNPANEMVTRNGEAFPTPSEIEGMNASFNENGTGYFIADGLYMYTAVEVDHEVETRAGTIPLDPGTRLRIVAYEEGTAYHTHQDYMVGGNHELVGDLFQVDPGNYKFVAYSYNTSDLPPSPDVITISDINPDIDLLWGCFPASGSYNISENSAEEIPITLVHQFSQVKVMITTEGITSGTFNITHINNVLMVPNQKARLHIKDGTMEPGSDISMQGFSFSSSGIPSPTVTSESRRVFTNQSDQTNVWIGSMTLNGTSFINQTAIFNKPLTGGVSYTLKISFRRESSPIVDSNPTPDMLMYVGAFWKKDQTGERLIRIPRPTTSSTAADGEWTARVIVGNEWIVLDKEMTTDPYVNWITTANDHLITNGNDPGFDDTHKVNSILTATSGKLGTGPTEKPEIYFRIGLKSKNLSIDSPRYGMVLLTYNNNSKMHRIWIRQGEMDDHVFSNEDPISVNGVSNRTVTRRFSPYNLSANNLDAQVAVNGGVFTAYPTQSGALFTWADASYLVERFAWNPYSIFPHSHWMYTGVAPIGYWETIKYNHETCPPQYRRPNDGYTNGAENGNNLNRSEMRQSLLFKPQADFNYQTDVETSIWGYYADGFFDRRAMEIIDKYDPFPSRPATVASGTKDIAHVGRLFFNPIETSSHYCASLFFPATGDRYPTSSSGMLEHYGHYGWYWTSSAADANSGILFRIRADQYGAQLWKAVKHHAAAIRCVAVD